MPKASYAYTNFTAGEWSPQLDGRIDLAKYRNAVRRMENFIIRPQGSAVHRPGTRFVGETKNNSPARLIPFRFAADESLILELTAGAIRFHCNNPSLCPLPLSAGAPYTRIDLPAPPASLMNGGFQNTLSPWVLGQGTVDQAVLAAAGGVHLSGRKDLTGPGVFPVTIEQTLTSSEPDAPHVLRLALEGFPEARCILEVVQVADGSSLIRRSLPPGDHLIEIRPAAGDLKIAITVESLITCTMRSVGFAPAGAMELPLPYGQEELERIQFVQSADVVYLAHQSHPPKVLKRYGALSWSFEDFDYANGPFMATNATETTLIADGRTGRVTINASSRNGINGGLGFLGSDVGRLLRIHDGVVRIADVLTPTRIRAEVQRLEDGRVALTPFYDLSEGEVKFIEGDPDNTKQPHSDRLYDSSNQFLEKGFLGGMRLGLYLPLEATEPPPEEPDNGNRYTIESVPAGIPRNGPAFIASQVSDDTMILSEGAQIPNPTAALYPGWPSLARGYLVGELEHSKDWALGLWSDTTGYPSCLTFFEDRLFFGGTPALPQRIDGSRTGDYGNFLDRDPDDVVLADHALAFTLSAEQVNGVLWLRSSDKGLLIGTTGGEWVMRPSALNEALSPENVVAKRTSTFGSAPVPPELISNVALFLQRDRRTLREMAFVFEADGFKAPDMTILSDHVSQGGIRCMAYAQAPDSILWMARGDGALLGFTYLREQDVLGWHRHVLGGFSNAERTEPAAVESLAVVPAADGSHDELWMSVRRNIAGQERRHIEVLGRKWQAEDGLSAAFFVDAGRSFRAQPGQPISKLGGLEHLKGETVAILVNGAVHPPRAVDDAGEVLLDKPIADAVLQVGLPRPAILETLRIEAGAADGTAQGKTKRLTQVVFRLLETVGGRAGPDTGRLDLIPASGYRHPDIAMGKASQPFTGDSEPLSWPGGYETEGRIVFLQDLPLPATLVAIFPQIVTQDR